LWLPKGISTGIATLLAATPKALPI